MNPNDVRHVLRKWAHYQGWDVTEEDIRDIAADILGTIPALYLATVPIADPDGTCHRFSVTRPDMKHLTTDDLNDVRTAFRQEPLNDEELATYDIADWQET